MRLLAALFAFAGLVSPLAANEPRAEAKENVQFDGEMLGLAFEGEDPSATIKEYLPAGEKLDRWTRLAAIRKFSNLEDPVAYAAATIKELRAKYQVP